MGVARLPTVDSYRARIFHVQAGLEAPRIFMGRMYQAVVFNSSGAANKGCIRGIPRAPRDLPHDDLYRAVLGHKQGLTDDL